MTKTYDFFSFESVTIYVSLKSGLTELQPVSQLTLVLHLFQTGKSGGGL